MEIMLVNIMTARMRSLSDPILDNSLACLQGDLRAKGIGVKVIDGCNLELYENFTLKPINRIFRAAFAKILKDIDRGAKARRIFLAGGFFLDTLLQKYQCWQMEKWLKEVAIEVAKEQIPFLGVKTWYGDAYGWAKRLVALVNKYSPETITICGGPQANIYHADGAVLKFSNFDLAVYSVGQGILAEVIEKARSGRNKVERLELIKKAGIKNLIYRHGEKLIISPPKEANMVETVIPHYSLQSGKILMHNLVDGLGCPWNKCNFCPHKNVTPNYQARRVEEVIMEIKAVLAQGIGVFRFCGSDTPLKVGVKLAEAILEEEMQLIFSMFSRAVKHAKVNYVTIREAYRLLIRAGLRAVFMGIETANDVINEQMLNKNLCCEDTYYTLKAIKEASLLEECNCDIIMAFIHPVPLVQGITSKQVLAENIELIKMVEPASVLITPAGVFPETAWYNEADRFGFNLGKNYLYDLMHLEYILSKPPQLWKNIPEIKMNGKDSTGMFRESGEFRRAVNELNIPTGIGDEVVLMYRLAGYSDNKKLIKANQQLFTDLTACNYDRVREFYKVFNQASKAIADKNFTSEKKDEA